MTHETYLKNLNNTYAHYNSYILDPNKCYKIKKDQTPQQTQDPSNINKLEPKIKRNNNFFYFKSEINDIGFHSFYRKPIGIKKPLNEVEIYNKLMSQA